jgi:hypothetical protein
VRSALVKSIVVLYCSLINLIAWSLLKANFAVKVLIGGFFFVNPLLFDGDEENSLETLLDKLRLSDELSADALLADELLAEEIFSGELLDEENLSGELLADNLSGELLAEEKLSRDLLAEECLSEELLEDELLETPLLEAICNKRSIASSSLSSLSSIGTTGAFRFLLSEGFVFAFLAELGVPEPAAAAGAPC